MNGHIEVAKDQGIYAIALMGDVRMVLCLSFDKFIKAMFDDMALRSVVFDLRSAEAVDSTTLGLIAKIALRCKKRALPKPVLVAEEPGMLRLLDTMGFDELFLITGSFEPAIDGMQSLECEDGTEQHFKQHVLEAHQVLMSLNENNRKAFCELVESLEK